MNTIDRLRHLSETHRHLQKRVSLLRELHGDEGDWPKPVSSYEYRFEVMVNGPKKTGKHIQTVGARDLAMATRSALDFSRSASHDRNPGPAKLLWTDDPRVKS